MALAEATKTTEPTYTVHDAMDILLGILDEAIDGSDCASCVTRRYGLGIHNSAMASW